MALTWGGSSIFIYPDVVAYQAFHAFVLAGMCAGAFSTLSFRKTPILIFLLITLIPTTYQLFLIEGSAGVSMGIMCILFLIILIRNGLKIYADTEENIRLRINAIKREKALIESEERFRMIFESAPLGILHYSNDGRIESYNSALATMLKINSEMAQGKRLSEIVDPSLMVMLNKALKGEEIKHSGSIDELYPTNDVEVRMYMRGIAGLEGEMVGGVMILEDISKEKQLDQAKDDFVATVSHELRTPLTAIIGSLGLLRSGVLDNSPEKIKPLLENAYRNSERLLHLINDILDMEKIKAGKMAYAMRNKALHLLLEQAVESSQGKVDPQVKTENTIV